MSYLIDSDWIADWLAGHQPTVEAIASLKRSGIAVSAISYMEIIDGIAGGYERRQRHQSFRRFLRGNRLLVVSRPTADRAGHIRADLRRRKRPVEDRVLDIIIAATAIEHGLILVTRNTRDYEDIPGLRLYEPEK